MNAASVAVVGAGLAGLACARVLSDAGVPVRVFESLRAPGGRLATRRFAAASFDHGAQYLVVSDPRFEAVLGEAAAAGAAAPWRPEWPQRDGADTLWVGTPAMSSLPKHLAAGLEVEYGARILRIARERNGWALLDDRGAAYTEFSAIAIALPAPAAAELAQGRTPLAARVRLATMAPCWAVMAAFDAPLAGVADAAFAGDAVLAWYARNGSKPGREARESWVLHASPDWSFVELDQSPEYVKRALLERFARIIGLELPRALVTDAHRWRHARVQSPAGEAFLLDREAGIGFCGDWCLEARAEAAWRSGTALGEELARTRAMPASGKIRESR